ncbi:Pex24p-domain-containing protein [Durotheca rogersii]|uniref:Pex24p-domain-containing protein n=1 Tax=Durotheca rogersii TaxID=419775 RepID=UPI00221F2DCB|nr:Pex24p-domain-containing protein [Durotheca rogersii]KAI5861271.1 Pex24p-domain-containing protein [Durotheca rogersii]
MDDFGADVFVNRDDPIPTVVLDGSTPPKPRTPPNQADHSDAESNQSHNHRRGLRGRFSAFKEKAKIQDQLVEKLLAQIVPLDDDAYATQDDQKGDAGGGSPGVERPNFNLTTMSTNFRRFNARIGVVFVFQARVIRLLSWRQPTHTLSFLAIYTFICLDPYLLPPLLLAILLVGVLVPSFVARHPAVPFNLSSEQAIGYSPHGPPIAPAVTVKPVKELSRDFFRNMRDLQNSMEDFTQLHDAVAQLVVPRTNFSDEAFSSALFAVLFGACLFMSIASNALPWRLIFLSLGWAVTCSGHPAAQRQLQAAHERHIHPQEARAMSWVERWVERDVVLDSAPETREVEVFELQRLRGGAGGEWEPWLFSASPHDPLSAARIAGRRPAGTRFFEDVLPPRGWEWSEKKWALDLWSREWVEERIITGVEVETEGERWVYDIYDEQQQAAAARVGVVELPVAGVVDDDASYTGSSYSNNNNNDSGSNGSIRAKARAARPRPSWEEGEDGDGRRGEWRRRRWVRLVKRKNMPNTEA